MIDTSLDIDFFDSGESLVWHGRSTVRGAQDGDAVIVRIAGLTTQTRVYKARVGAFFRKEMRALRPDRARAYVVHILIEVGPRAPRHDVDNVAKALLDAMTGAVFWDDSQVTRLVVERVKGEASRIWARAAPRPEAS